jgi:hypothetical protein
VPYVDSGAAELLFRHKVLKLLLKTGLLSEERAALLLSWRHHTGFSVHNQTRVAADEFESLERLARYLLRPAVSLERLRFDEESGEVRYRRKTGHGQMAEQTGQNVEERFDPLEFVARVVVQIPHPRLHEIRYYGAYSAVVRARRRHEACGPTSEPSANSVDEPSSACDGKPNPALRRQWAELIRRVYETNPLVCHNCGQPMSIIAFITERAVILKILHHLDKRDTSERGPPNTG